MAIKELKKAALLGACLLAFAGCAKNADGNAASASTKTAVSIEGSALERMEKAFEIAQTTQGDGNPALWKMADEDTTIYLYGSFHLLPQELSWKTPEMESAFAAADTLYLEVDTTSPDAAAALQAAVMKNAMFSNGDNLETILTEEQYAKLVAATQKIGLPDGAIDSTKPWFASLQLTIMQMMKEGYDPNSGVETVLTELAKSSGKSFGYFETAEEQIGVLSGAPMDEQIEGLVFLTETLDKSATMTNLLLDEWADGDTTGLGVLMSNPAMFGSQRGYEALIVNRNKNWIPQIEAILDNPGTKFIAVGAGHMSGPDSVISMLQDKGHKIETVQ